MPRATRCGLFQGVRLLFVLSLLLALSVTADIGDRVHAAPAAADDATPIKAEPIQPAAVSVVNMRDLANQSAARSAAAGERHEVTPLRSQVETASQDRAPSRSAPGPGLVGPAAVSPPPLINFAGVEDEPKVGLGVFVIPPQTMGAVGATQIQTTLRNNYRVQDKATGVAIVTVAIDTFWSGLGATNILSPKTLYDPYNGRWIMAAVSDPGTAASSLLLGISQTNDATGAYVRFRIDADASNTLFLDAPGVGFNKNWVAIAGNMLNNATAARVETRLWMVDYPGLRAGAPTLFTITGITAPDLAGIQPAVTYSATEDVLYAPNHISSGAATYRVSTITGAPPTAPTFTIGAVKTNPLGGWSLTETGADTLPQQCASGCPTTPLKITAGDSRILNAVFRNGSIYFTQIVGLPTGGAITHTAAQWVQTNTAGDSVQTGRVEDPTATATNGGKWYAYPSISANQDNDVLLGFSQFASNQFASAGYALRRAGDAAGTMRDPVVYKAGEDYYQKTFAGTRNLWGDYSATVIDPSDDRTFWTLQEYAETRAVPNGLDVNDSRWGTWWAKVAPSVTTLTVTKQGTGSGTVTATGIDCGTDCSQAYAAGTAVTLTASPAAGSLFAGWSGGGCSGTGTCQVTLNADTAVTATFTLGRTLTVTKTGTGTGTVTATGVNCGPDCTELYAPGTPVNLTAAPTNGSTFIGWAGTCASAGTNPVCNLTMNADATAEATFTRAVAARVTVEVSKLPPGPPGSDRKLSATLTAPSGCGPITKVQFGKTGEAFDNATVTITSPSGGPPTQSAAFTYTPTGSPTTITFTVARATASGAATVRPIVVTDGCGTWNTFVGGGPNAFT